MREVAVGLGQELQAAVTQGDELITEGFQLRSEAAALEAEIGRFQKQDVASVEELQQVVAHCRRLGYPRDSACDELSEARDVVQSELVSRAPHNQLRGELHPARGIATAQRATARSRAEDLPNASNERSSSSSSRGPGVRDERARLLSVLERQDRQLLLLQQAAQRLSGSSYIPGPSPADDVDRAVRAAFKDLGAGIAPPLVRLPKNRNGIEPGSAKHAMFLFDTTLCEARVDLEADTGGPDQGGSVRFRVQPGGRLRAGCHGDAAGELWLSAAQLVDAVGWVPQESAGSAARARRREALR